jgi:hypothetical protein
MTTFRTVSRKTSYQPTFILIVGDCHSTTNANQLTLLSQLA